MNPKLLAHVDVLVRAGIKVMGTNNRGEIVVEDRGFLGTTTTIAATTKAINAFLGASQ